MFNYPRTEVNRRLYDTCTISHDCLELHSRKSSSSIHVPPTYTHASTVKPVLSDQAWAKKSAWSLNRGGLLIEVKMPELGKWSLNRGGL